MTTKKQPNNMLKYKRERVEIARPVPFLQGLTLEFIRDLKKNGVLHLLMSLKTFYNNAVL